ncbi:hypothetical protein BN2475_320006 [Paraburkholderia ribeironis]|uniref:Uncharacterized protein n=1 Tax=Paraburkholderia ribeironis TaxID=1247936 RepID=A0A1N7S2Z6_9BURK|nr:hypothetical protein BN2475_320006 [Paraburkholderia ribeironis]
MAPAQASQIRFDFAAFFLLEFRFAYFQPPVPKPLRRSGKDQAPWFQELERGSFRETFTAFELRISVLGVLSWHAYAK